MECSLCDRSGRPVASAETNPLATLFAQISLARLQIVVHASMSHSTLESTSPIIVLVQHEV